VKRELNEEIADEFLGAMVFPSYVQTPYKLLLFKQAAWC